VDGGGGRWDDGDGRNLFDGKKGGVVAGGRER